MHRVGAGRWGRATCFQGLEPPGTDHTGPVSACLGPRPGLPKVFSEDGDVRASALGDEVLPASSSAGWPGSCMPGVDTQHPGSWFWEAQGRDASGPRPTRPSWRWKENQLGFWGSGGGRVQFPGTSGHMGCGHLVWRAGRPHCPEGSSPPVETWSSRAGDESRGLFSVSRGGCRRSIILYCHDDAVTGTPRCSGHPAMAQGGRACSTRVSPGRSAGHLCQSRLGSFARLGSLVQEARGPRWSKGEPAAWAQGHMPHSVGPRKPQKGNGMHPAEFLHRTGQGHHSGGENSGAHRGERAGSRIRWPDTEGKW